MEKSPGTIRIAVLGGSSAYCVSVPDAAAWPAVLENLLGPGFEVVNMGVPGYSSVDHVIQTAFHVPNLQCDIAVFYMGWNDAKYSHVPALKPDYAEHGRSQYGNLSLPQVWTGPNLACVRLLVPALERMGWVHAPFSDCPTPSAGTLSGEIDPQALSYFERNTRSLISLCRSEGIVPVFVPQVMNRGALSADSPTVWVPYVPARDLPGIVSAYNDRVAQLADRDGVHYVSTVLEADWEGSDFLDEGHFSREGCERFAELVASYIRTDVADNVSPSAPGKAAHK
jgi:lysophospholipase L1-like esterase